jgi:saccharopine dehydrogenase-like NADP-dependent oxidoreductase
MKKVLILGAGLVSKPGVTYLLQDKEILLTVASRTVSKAEKLVEGFENGVARQIDVADQAELESLIKDNDIIVSLLPWIHHIKVARLCLKNNKHMATTSYVSAEMRQLDQQARDKNLLFLNEIGVDPGIDHMSAMKIIDEVHEEGGRVVHFYSYCGGLPAPDDNDNPFGYKFSWSPKGVVLASKSPAQFLENNAKINIEGKELFANYRIEEVEGLGTFEVYPNRDSMPYKELYGLKEAETVLRGTYRNQGWCTTFKKIVDMGLVNDQPDDTLKNISYRKMIANLMGIEDSDRVIEEVAKRLNLDKDSDVIKRLEWLGLFSEEQIPDYDNLVDILSHRLLEKLVYKEGERDMILLRHKFIVQNKDGSKDLITSTLIDYGIPGGDTSMARTVSLPLAIAVQMMAHGQIQLTGVQIPITKALYQPVLTKLAEQEIKMIEKRVPLR